MATKKTKKRPKKKSSTSKNKSTEASEGQLKRLARLLGGNSFLRMLEDGRGETLARPPVPLPPQNPQKLTGEANGGKWKGLDDFGETVSKYANVDNRKSSMNSRIQMAREDSKRKTGAPSKKK